MHYGAIKFYDIANGEGVRVSLFVSGCRNHCKGCFNKETWDFEYGKVFTRAVEDSILKAMSARYISGLSVLGGEPFEAENQMCLYPFLKRVKECLPSKTIWCYTGYILERDIEPDNGRKHTEVTEAMLSLIDVLVDGPFIEEKKSLMLKFRGSENQRILLRTAGGFQILNETR